MKSTKFLFRSPTLYFILFFVFALIAFWPGYFSDILGDMDFHFHAHGISLTLWCAMLIVQPILIQKKQIRVHRLVGKFSYLLVPVIFFATINLLHFRLSGLTRLYSGHYYFMALAFNGIVAFLVLYSLAIYFRKNREKHSRFMIATIFPMFTPVTDRLIYGHFPFAVEWAPNFGFGPIVPVIGFLLADLVLVILLFWDWRKRDRLDVFPLVLAVTGFYQITVLTFYQFVFWKNFSYWFLELPLP